MSPFPVKRLWPLAILAVVAPALFLFWQPPPAPSVTPLPARPTPVPRPAAPPAAAPVAIAPSPAPSSPPTPRPHPDLDAALAGSDPQQRAQQFLPKFVALFSRDFEAALAYLREMRRGPEFPQALLLLLEHLSRRDPARALTIAGELAVTRDDRNVYSMLFDRFARENVSRAIVQLKLVPTGEARDNALRALTDAWVRADPAAALAWAQQLADPADRNIALESALRDLAMRDPARAITAVQESLTGPGVERILQFAFQILASKDPTQASQLLLAIPPGDVQTLSAMDVARALAMRDIPAALVWARTIPIDFTQWLALTSILSVWAQKDPMAAARYVVEMPAGPGVDYIAGQFAAVVALKPQDAILWAEALPSITARNAAFVTIASSWAQRSPVDAIRWAESLEGEPLRTNAMTGVHSLWRMLDPRAAQEWLAAAKLPSATKAKILAPR